MAHEQDHGYRLLFSHPQMVRHLIQGFVREPWTVELDFDSLERVDASYVSDDLRERSDDLVWRLRWRGSWLYVYLVLEFQSTVDRFMAVRILTYLGLLYQDLIRGGRLTPGGKLPPVVPLVLYNGKRRWTAAEDVSELIDSGPASLARYRPRLRYALLDEIRYPRSELEPVANPVAGLFRLEQSRSRDEAGRVVEKLVELLAGERDAGLRRSFATFLGRVLLPSRAPEARIPELDDLREIETMLRESVLEWTREWVETGRKSGEATVVQRLLEKKFGDLGSTHVERLETASEPQLMTWADRLLTARSIDEVFGEE